MLRYLVEQIDGTTLEKVDFTSVHGQEGVREATVTAGGKQLKVAIVNGLKNARALCDDVRAGKSPYVAIEVMTCPGGCINGGGQPYAAWNRRTIGIMPTLMRIKNAL